MTRAPLKVGIIGVQPGRSWAARSHIPALRALPDLYELVGVANTSRSSADAAAASCGIPRAFDNAVQMVNSPDIDVVAVTVRVPFHLELVKAAADAGKHVYCEWPLGNGLAEAERMAALVKRHGVVGVVGNQARVAPEIQYLRTLIDQGYVGEVLSTSLIGRGRSWGAFLDSEAVRAYLIDRSNGATMLTIPMGHTLAALRDLLGDITALSAFITNRRREVPALDTGNILPMTAPDQVMVNGVLANGAPLSIHYRGGEARGIPGLVWEINGTDGDIRITGANGNAQMVKLTLEGARGDDAQLHTLEVPKVFSDGFLEEVVPGNVGRLWARMAADIFDGTRTAPDFADAVELHRVIDTIERAATQSTMLPVNAPVRRIPLNTELAA